MIPSSPALFSSPLFRSQQCAQPLAYAQPSSAPPGFSFDDDEESHPAFGFSFESDEEPEDKENAQVSKARLLEKLDADFSALKRTAHESNSTPSKRMKQQRIGDSLYDLNSVANDKEVDRAYRLLESVADGTNNGTYNYKSKSNNSTSNHKSNNTTSNQQNINYLSIPKHTNSFQLGTNSKGVRLYFPKKSLNRTAEILESSRSLLSIPIFKLMQQLKEELRIEKHVNENNALLAANAAARGEAPLAENTSGFLSKGTELWVNKYRPKMYIDLVGDEVN